MTTACRNTDRDARFTDMGLWRDSIPVDVVDIGTGSLGPKECIGDRVPGAVAWNIVGIDAKFGDVHPVEECVAQLDRLGAAAVAAE